MNPNTAYLTQRFADQVLETASLSPARRGDLRDSCEITTDPPVFSLTCTITGSTYERDLDGSELQAMEFVNEAAEDTASLITGTRHYAWMRSKR